MKDIEINNLIAEKTKLEQMIADLSESAVIDRMSLESRLEKISKSILTFEKAIATAMSKSLSKKEQAIVDEEYYKK